MQRETSCRSATNALARFRSVGAYTFQNIQTVETLDCTRSRSATRGLPDLAFLRIQNGRLVPTFREALYCIRLALASSRKQLGSNAGTQHAALGGGRRVLDCWYESYRRERGLTAWESRGA